VFNNILNRQQLMQI